MNETIVIKPQAGKQTQFLASKADIAIYGGSAGGGKTWALLLEPLRHVEILKFGAVIFRRSYPEVTREGGMWDESQNIYPLLGAKSNKQDLQYMFPSKAKITFGHLQYEDTKYDWRGAQIPLLEFDQLETFTETQFFYLLARNRSLCGIRPYLRSTANPEPGWLADFLSWWIAEDGYADLERAGKMRWFVRVGETIHWADKPKELHEQFPNLSEHQPQSVTFIPATIYDNPILMEKDPGYLGRLLALPLVDRERLLGDRERGGNWKIKPAAGKVFNREWFEIVDAIPGGVKWFVRGWDLAATEPDVSSPDPAYTAGVKMCKANGIVYVLDCISKREGPAAIDSLLRNTATQDGRTCAVRWELEGGSSGKRDARTIITLLHGFDAKPVRPQGDKVFRLRGLAAQALAKNVKLLRGAWNESYLNHMHNQPDHPYHDISDASAVAYQGLLEVEMSLKVGSFQG